MDFPLSDFETVIKKAQKYCAYQERCQWDLEKKFRVWQVVEEIQDEVLADLISQGFVNEERFAKHFASGKFRIKKWGKKKIQLELKKRQISNYSINKAIEAIEDEEYDLTLQQLIQKKVKVIQAKNEFEKKQKLAQYLYSKGYENERIWNAIHSNDNE